MLTVVGDVPIAIKHPFASKGESHCVRGALALQNRLGWFCVQSVF